MPKATHVVGVGDDARGAGTPRSGGAAERGGLLGGLFGRNLPLLDAPEPCKWCDEAQNFPAPTRFPHTYSIWMNSHVSQLDKPR